MNEYDTGLTLKDVIPTGEYRAPSKDELYVSEAKNNAIYRGHGGHPESDRRIIVRERELGAWSLESASFEELSAELMRRFEASRLTEKDAREATLAMLTHIALDEALPMQTRFEASKTILQYGTQL